jgi:hypothetical protein
MSTYLQLGNWAKLIENDKDKQIKKDRNAWGAMTARIPTFNIMTIRIMTFSVT